MADSLEWSCLDDNPRFIKLLWDLYLTVVSTRQRSLRLSDRKPTFMSCMKPKLSIDLQYYFNPNNERVVTRAKPSCNWKLKTIKKPMKTKSQLPLKIKKPTSTFGFTQDTINPSPLNESPVCDPFISIYSTSIQYLALLCSSVRWSSIWAFLLPPNVKCGWREC